jgi:hypothetical protein
MVLILLEVFFSQKLFSTNVFVQNSMFHVIVDGKEKESITPACCSESATKPWRNVRVVYIPKVGKDLDSSKNIRKTY